MSVREAQARYEAAREEARAAEAKARAEFAVVIRESRQTRSLAQLAAELGVSRQRVEQLSKERS